MPAALAAIVGGWSPFLIVGVGCRVDADRASPSPKSASRFDGTGGPYLYTRAAFGRFAAFEVGWMQWFTRAASWASVINVLVASLGFYWPSVTAGRDADAAADGDHRGARASSTSSASARARGS